MNKTSLYFVLPLLIIALIIFFILQYMENETIDYSIIGLLVIVISMVYFKLKK
jgi:chromate transport protein ChrA